MTDDEIKILKVKAAMRGLVIGQIYTKCPCCLPQVNLDFGPGGIQTNRGFLSPGERTEIRYISFACDQHIRCYKKARWEEIDDI